MTKEEVLEAIGSVKDTEITIIIIKTPKMRKKGNPYLDAVETIHVRALVNYDYEEQVNLAKAKDGQDVDPDSAENVRFISTDRTWGTRIDSTPLIEHRKKVYLNILLLQEYFRLYYNKSGKVANKDIAPFLYSREDDSELQGLEERMKPKTIDITHIKRLVKGSK